MDPEERRPLLEELAACEARLRAQTLHNRTTFGPRHALVAAEERVILSDAGAPGTFSADPALRRRGARSVLCLPIVRQGAVAGLLYLENNLVRGAFTTERLAVLELLAAQAAISLQNEALNRDLEKENAERERAEEALRENERLMKAIFDISRAVILV